jgi:hypothetical protein
MTYSEFKADNATLDIGNTRYLLVVYINDLGMLVASLSVPMLAACCRYICLGIFFPARTIYRASSSKVHAVAWQGPVTRINERVSLTWTPYIHFKESE